MQSGLSGSPGRWGEAFNSATALQRCSTGHGGVGPELSAAPQRRRRPTTSVPPSLPPVPLRTRGEGWWAVWALQATLPTISSGAHSKFTVHSRRLPLPSLPIPSNGLSSVLYRVALKPTASNTGALQSGTSVASVTLVRFSAGRPTRSCSLSRPQLFHSLLSHAGLRLQGDMDGPCVSRLRNDRDHITRMRCKTAIVCTKLSLLYCAGTTLR
jgi:hypothetical protein